MAKKPTKPKKSTWTMPHVFQLVLEITKSDIYTMQGEGLIAI